MAIKIIKLNEKAILPTYQTEHAAGVDLYACLDDSLTLQPMQRAMIPTGLAIELPPLMEAQIRARSGLSINHGLTMVNGVGTIDADYRGEINVLAINLGQEPFVVEHGMRIAQMVMARVEKIVWQEAISLNDTTRGVGGFGSTGVDKLSQND